MTNEELLKLETQVKDTLTENKVTESFRGACRIILELINVICEDRRKDGNL